ncbi:MAG: recombinase family protein [Neisseriaceae bacterium]|nr:recombinase family protein [Bacteroidales bacterium]MBQ9259424.1 recombinase family protein [Neisseriaceae bacterium]MBQ9260473.1 recombinase family protein [Neisseriaceae bacterium]MBQ9725340.1 recombinase family protein [Neisseriaceae bacterium]
MKVGYIRVSTLMQNTVRQLDGVAVDKTFVEHSSGKTVERPVLRECLSFVREGDTLIVHSMDRLARNLMDLRNIVEMLNDKGVVVQFIKENLTFDGKNKNPMSNLMLSLMGAFAEFERELILERQKEGIELAKQRKVYLGRPKKLSEIQEEEILEQLEYNQDMEKIGKRFGVSRITVWRIANRAKKANEKNNSR